MTGIPLPGQPGDALLRGLSTGSQMFSNIMHPILAREQLAQQMKIHADNLALQKAAQGRMAQAASDAHKLALMKLDPDFALNQMRRAYEAFGNGGQQQPTNQESYMPSIGGMLGQNNNSQSSEIPGNILQPNEQQSQLPEMSAQLAKEPQSIPTINENAISPFDAASTKGQMNMDVIKASPILRGMFKKLYGVDPAGSAVKQTPEDKQKMALDLFKQKEAIKTANKTGSGETLTAPIKTKYQNVIGGVTSARPILQKLIAEVKKGNIPGQMIGSLFKRDAQANYKGEISTLLDGIRNAYTIPNTDSGTAKAEDKVLRKPGESDANYANRLQAILDQLDLREKDARVKLNAGNITAGLVHLVGPNGEDYDVPEDEVDTILAENPGVRRG